MRGGHSVVFKILSREKERKGTKRVPSSLRARPADHLLSALSSRSGYSGLAIQIVSNSNSKFPEFESINLFRISEFKIKLMI